MSSNAIIAAANQEIKEATGTQVLAGSPLLINISDQSLTIIGFWNQHVRYVVGVRADGEIIALNGVAKSVANKMGWRLLPSPDDKKAEHKIMPGIVTLIEIGLILAGDKDPDAIPSMAKH
jgi:hypothetical protein